MKSCLKRIHVFYIEFSYREKFAEISSKYFLRKLFRRRLCSIYVPSLRKHFFMNAHLKRICLVITNFQIGKIRNSSNFLQVSISYLPAKRNCFSVLFNSVVFLVQRLISVVEDIACHAPKHAGFNPTMVIEFLYFNSVPVLANEEWCCFKRMFSVESKR